MTNLSWLKYSLKFIFICIHIFGRKCLCSIHTRWGVFGYNYWMVSIFILRISWNFPSWCGHKQKKITIVHSIFEQRTQKNQSDCTCLNCPTALSTVRYSMLNYRCKEFMNVCVWLRDDDVDSRHQNTLQQKSTSCWHECAYTKSVSWNNQMISVKCVCTRKTRKRVWERLIERDGWRGVKQKTRKKLREVCDVKLLLIPFYWIEIELKATIKFLLAQIMHNTKRKLTYNGRKHQTQAHTHTHHLVYIYKFVFFFCWSETIIDREFLKQIS